MCTPPFMLRQILAIVVLASFIAYFFTSGISVQIWPPVLSTQPGHKLDFGRYTRPRTLSADEFPLDKRVIMVGDIHGMHKPFLALLHKLSYDPSTDVLIHAGDIIAKGPHEGSLAVLSYMATNNITGVRGNHDQKVIEWRGWLDWIRTQDGGQTWLQHFHTQYKEAEASGAVGDDPEAWAEEYLRSTHKTNGRWWRRIPPGWKILSDHYRLAHAMSDSEYAYLLSLPLVLHVPSAHVFIAHAGVLPSDPRYKPDHPRQPLSRVPKLPRPSSSEELKSPPAETIARLRALQESAILSEVPQNSDPWVTLNMRGVLRDGAVTRAQDGEPWSDMWNREVARCAGFDTGGRHMNKNKKGGKHAKPCYPASVVYGHAASRGLDVKRWSVGLDSGCVYEKRLSSLVLDAEWQRSPFTDSDELDKDELESRKKKKKKEKDTPIPFDQGTGRIISVSCAS